MKYSEYLLLFSAAMRRHPVPFFQLAHLLIVFVAAAVAVAVAAVSLCSG